MSWSQTCQHEILTKLISKGFSDPKIDYSKMSSTELIDELEKANRKILDYSKNYKPPKAIQNQIDQAYARTDLSAKDKAKIAYDLILENEIKLLSPKSQERMRELNLNLTTSNSNEFGGSFSPKTTARVLKPGKKGKSPDDYKTKVLSWDEVSLSVSMRLPEKFHDSALDYGMRMHEMFHAIQYEIFRNAQVTNIKKYTPYDIAEYQLNGTKGRWFNEANSIASEWRYLQSIPITEKKAILKELIADDTISSKEKELVIRFLESNFSSGRSHILSEHKAGRYSKKEFINNNKKELLLWGGFTGGVASIIAVPLVLNALKNNCLSKVSIYGNFEETVYFKKVCLGMPGVSSNVIMHINCRRQPGCSIVSF